MGSFYKYSYQYEYGYRPYWYLYFFLLKNFYIRRGAARVVRKKKVRQWSCTSSRGP